MPTGDPPVPMVAREPELRALQTALSQVEQGETAAVFITGASEGSESSCGIGLGHPVRDLLFLRKK